MAKLRKMLGNINDGVIVQLMRIIEKQSSETLSLWAVDYVESNILDIYEKETDNDLRLREVVAAVRECIKGNIKLKDLKVILKEVKMIPKELDDNPVAQAAARAIITACGVIQTPTNALGFTFYAAAAVVYNEAGLNEKSDIYDKLAGKEFEKILKSLEETAIENEENPVSVNWNC